MSKTKKYRMRTTYTIRCTERGDPSSLSRPLEASWIDAIAVDPVKNPFDSSAPKKGAMKNKVVRVPVNSDGFGGTFYFTEEDNEEGLPQGLVQGGWQATGIPLDGKLVYYSLTGRFRTERQRLRYRAWVDADPEDRFRSALSIEVEGLHLPDGTYNVCHPHDPLGQNTFINLTKGTGTLLVESRSPHPDPEALMAPRGPVLSLLTFGGTVEFSNRISQDSVTFSDGVKWSVLQRPDEAEGAGASGAQTLCSFTLEKDVVLTYEMTLRNLGAPHIELIEVDTNPDRLADTGPSHIIPVDGTVSFLIHKAARLTIQTSLLADMTVTSTLLGLTHLDPASER